MTKIIVLAIILFTLTACSGNAGQSSNGSNSEGTSAAETSQTSGNGFENSSASTKDNNPAANNSKVKKDGFMLEYENTKIYMNENMAEVLDKLGEPRRKFESPSCAFDGTDLIFSYPGFEIYTYPEDNNDYIHQINFRDDSITTPEGIYLGSTKDEMIAAYGRDYRQEFSQYTYSKGETELMILISEEGTVESIIYRFII